MQQLLFWFLQIIYAVNEVTAMLQDESNFVSANIYSQPPQNGNDTDEDSGSEDSGVTVDNLTGRQLRAEASATIFTSDRFSIFFSVRFFNKFAVKWLLKIPPHLAYFATLPSDGSVATCLRCGGVVNNQIKKGLLLSLPVKKNYTGEYLAMLQARRWLSHALCAPGHQIAKRRKKCTRQPHSCL